MIPGNLGPSERRANEEESRTVTHCDFIERLRSLQDALFLSPIELEVKQQIFKDLNDMSMKVFCDEIRQKKQEDKKR